MVMARKTRLTIFDEPEAGIDLWSFNNLIDVFKSSVEKFKAPSSLFPIRSGFSTSLMKSSSWLTAKSPPMDRGMRFFPPCFPGTADANSAPKQEEAQTV